jgi:hypothetical protein
MKIIVDRSRPAKLIKIRSAKYLKDFVIRITFDDNEERLVDFKPFLSKASHPEITKYLKESNFKKFKVESGNLNWNDYELIFPIEHLYQGLIK